MKKIVVYNKQEKTVGIYVGETFVCYFNNSTASSLFGVVHILQNSSIITSVYDATLELE